MAFATTVRIWLNYLPLIILNKLLFDMVQLARNSIFIQLTGCMHTIQHIDNRKKTYHLHCSDCPTSWNWSCKLTMLIIIFESLVLNTVPQIYYMKNLLNVGAIYNIDDPMNCLAINSNVRRENKRLSVKSHRDCYFEYIRWTWKWKWNWNLINVPLCIDFCVFDWFSWLLAMIHSSYINWLL